MANQAAAQRKPGADPVKVDARHYKVEFENEKVRVLRIGYGPHERSQMHSHPSSVAVLLSDHNARFTFPDGRSEERRANAGEVLWVQGEEHLPENLSDSRMELILIELKAGKDIG